MAAQRLNEQQRSELASRLPNWSVDGEKLRREFQFRDFVGAFGFMGQVALLAESRNTPIGATSTTACRSASPPTIWGG